MLDPVTQNLRRAGNGFALMVMLLVAPFVLFGLRGVWEYVTEFFGDPGNNWFYAAVYGGLFAFGLIRFLIGANRAAGARDALHISRNIFFFAVFFGISLYLAARWPWTDITTSGWGYGGLMLILGLVVWHALSFGMQITLSFWPRHSARRMVAGHIEEEEFRWDDDVPVRPWWQFWNKAR
ncbi:MAG: hypothetical protein ABI612_20245 [Betaproteobacteria bacterium]